MGPLGGSNRPKTGFGDYKFDPQNRRTAPIWGRKWGRGGKNVSEFPVKPPLRGLAPILVTLAIPGISPHVTYPFHAPESGYLALNARFWRRLISVGPDSKAAKTSFRGPSSATLKEPHSAITGHFTRVVHEWVAANR